MNNEGEISMILARIGMGNQNQDHVHRNNTMNLNSMAIDRLKMEQHQGGISGTTLNQLAAQSGTLSANPYGVVSIEDGFNVRRGIGMLKFLITRNAISEVELSVLGYLTGGGADEEGIDPSTMFVPVRAWSTDTRQRQDDMGMPMKATAVISSNQFLLGDPFLQKPMRALRPMDVANEALGLLAMNKDGGSSASDYDGLLNGDLTKTVVVSKTNNLNPTHHSRELLRIAGNVVANHTSFGTENAFSDSLGASINEISPSENEFFSAMMFHLGTSHMVMNGFQGWSIAEIMQVFGNFPEVLDLQLLQRTKFSTVNHTLTSEQYGSITPHEIIASELAFMTIHTLMRVGLTHLYFNATNNPHNFNQIDTPVGWKTGAHGSVLDSDGFADRRIEDFKLLMNDEFFARYATGYIHNSTILSVEVTCSLFGETRVAIFFNDDINNTKHYTNATYCVNRTSTNITPSQASVDQAMNFMMDIRDHFTA